MKKRLDDHGISAHIVDLLAPWADVEMRRMFSGVGLFSRERMFGFIQDDVLYLKDSFDAQGEPLKTSFEKEYFEYQRLGKVARINFFKAPLSALEDGSYLAELVEQSWQSANARKARAKVKASAKSGSKTSGKPSSAKTKVSDEPQGKAKASAKPGSKTSGKSSSAKTKVAEKPRGKPPASVLKSPFL